jgi:hypothetical protein
MRRIACLSLGIAALAGCGSDPADVAGDYTVAVTNRDNGCDLTNWTQGNTADSIPVEISQNGEAATADVMGLVGGLLDAWLGSSLFTGTVDGSHLDLLLTGTTAYQQGECDYTIDATIDATITGDVLTGNILYEAQTDGDPECGDLTGCVSIQEFNGTRPPT